MAGKKRSILILAKEKSNWIQTVLKEEFSVTAVDPTETETLNFSENRPDCIIFDTSCSDSRTESLMEKIRLYEIALMILTDAKNPPILEKQVESILSTVLIYPVEEEELLFKVREFLSQVVKWKLEKIAGNFSYSGRQLVMVVDGDQMIGTAIQVYLKDWYDVVQVYNSRAALHFMEYLVPDVLFVDLEQPKKEDLEIHRELRKREYLKNIPFFYLTYERDRITMLRVKSTGAMGCIVKPIQKEELIIKLKEIFGSLSWTKDKEQEKGLFHEQAERQLKETKELLYERSEDRMEYTNSSKEKRYYILVVDDFSMTLKTMKVQLEGEYQVALAVSGKQALAFLEKHIPDLIFMDVEMPEMNGIETVKKIKENPEWKDIPIIFLTGNKEKDTIFSCLNLGVVDYMVKPVSVTKMQEKIREVLEKKDML